MTGARVDRPAAGPLVVEPAPAGALPAPSSAVLTLPNLVTAARLAGIPACAVLLARGDYGPGAALTALVAGTDWLDGWLARRYGQVSRVGQLLDPLADRLLLGATAAGLLASGVVEWPPVVLLAGRDVALLAGFGLLASRGLRPPDVTLLGKAATFELFTAVTVLVLSRTRLPVAGLARTLGPPLLWAGVGLYYAAGAGYVRTALRQLRRTDRPVAGDPDGPGGGRTTMSERPSRWRRTSVGRRGPGRIGDGR